MDGMVSVVDEHSKATMWHGSYNMTRTYVNLTWSPDGGPVQNMRLMRTSEREWEGIGGRGEQVFFLQVIQFQGAGPDSANYWQVTVPFAFRGMNQPAWTPDGGLVDRERSPRRDQ